MGCSTSRPSSPTLPGAADLTLTGAQTPTAHLRALATGELRGAIAPCRDSQDAETLTTLRFVAALEAGPGGAGVVEWPRRPYAGVDLRPAPVRRGSPARSRLLRGGAATRPPPADLKRVTRGLVRGPTSVSDWGDPGHERRPAARTSTSTGGGALIENISLNFPERDAAAKTADCTYGVDAHFFKDARNHGDVATCEVDATCADGEACDCTGARDRCAAAQAPRAKAPPARAAVFRRRSPWWYSRSPAPRRLRRSPCRPWCRRTSWRWPRLLPDAARRRMSSGLRRTGSGLRRPRSSYAARTGGRITAPSRPPATGCAASPAWSAHAYAVRGGLAALPTGLMWSRSRPDWTKKERPGSKSLRGASGKEGRQGRNLSCPAGPKGEGVYP